MEKRIVLLNGKAAWVEKDFNERRGMFKIHAEMARGF